MAARLIIGIPFAGLLFGGAADRRHHHGEPVYDREIFLGAEFAKSDADRLGSGIQTSNACFSDPCHYGGPSLTKRKSEPELASGEAQG